MYPLQKGTITRQAHVGIPDGLYEEEHGRDGFYGPVSHLYHQHPPTGWTRIEGPLKPQAFDLNQLKQSSDYLTSIKPVLFNKDVTFSVAQFSGSSEYFIRNADGDEVIFVHNGGGVLETDYGCLNYSQGDYLVIPRGTTIRWVPDQGNQFFLVIESASRIRQPDRGLLGQHALYDPAVVNTPEPKSLAGLQKQSESREFEIRIKRLNEWTSVFYPFNPLDVVGWKGDLTVCQLNVADIRPVLSHKAHLAPSVHTTFLGEQFVICTFLPRPLETGDSEALRVPFYHRNIDYDEVLFYHDGDFFSRDGINAGMLTFHPQGIHHGPHPNALKASWNKTETNEMAVMLDTRNPLSVSDSARHCEWLDYHLSWQEKEG